MMKPARGLVVRDWKQDVINLVQFARTKLIPSASMFSLKLETWLRMNKLNYTNVDNHFKVSSPKGQIPFIEVNGRQFSESNHIIEQLIQQYNLTIDHSLNTRERAEARAITILVEESLARVIMYDRSRDAKWMFSPETGFLGNAGGVKKFLAQNPVRFLFQKQLQKRLQQQGIGRNSPDEIDEIAKKDLSALSTLIGEKRYFFGDRPTTVDATVFGTLAQLLYTPLNSTKIKPFIEQSTPNLLEFIKRMKADFWPDWEVTCETLNMNTHLAPPPGENIIHATSPSQ